MTNICDFSNDELMSHKKEIYNSLIEFGGEFPNTILKKSLDTLLEIEKELNLREFILSRYE